MKKHNLISNDIQAYSSIDAFALIDLDEISNLASQIATSRGYPADMAQLINPD
jgi:hypothetical protein